ncbi:MAG: hydrogenase maturation protease [Chloroflexota bacterium]|nr:hydrogenase maturation protease [Chloroflexota bacterium]
MSTVNKTDHTAETAPIITIIGVGDNYRQDDAVGLAVAQELGEYALHSVRAVECNWESLSLIDAWEGADVAIVVDAVCSGTEPGTVHRFEAQDEPLPSQLFRCATHDFSLADAVERARALGKLPPRLIVYGIEGSAFGHGMGLSEKVAVAAHDVIHDLFGCVRSCLEEGASRK